MLSQSEANQCLEAAVADLKRLSYEELEKVAYRHAPDGGVADIVSRIEGEKAYISTTMQKIGRFRKRICVETVFYDEAEGARPLSPFIYFERFESGRLYPSPRELEMELGLGKMLPYALLGGVVMAVAALGWYLLMRPGSSNN